MLSILLEVNQRWLSPTTVNSVFKLLTQHILRVSSVGAGSFPLVRDSIFSHFVGPLSHIPIQMSSLFLLFLLFYCRKFSSSRWADRISLWRSFTRCRAAFSLLSRRLREGFLKYLLSLRVLSIPSFIMRFLRRETARSGFSLRLIFIVNIVLLWVRVCSCRAVARFLFSSTRVLYHTLLRLSSGPSQPPGRECGRPRVSVPACCLPLLLVALWYV